MTVIEQLPLDALDGLDLLPLAQFGHSPEHFEHRNRLAFAAGVDDLDGYRIVALGLDSPALRLVFALRAYRGAPPATTDILLPSSLLGARTLTATVDAIAAALGISSDRTTTFAAGEDQRKAMNLPIAG